MFNKLRRIFLKIWDSAGVYLLSFVVILAIWSIIVIFLLKGNSTYSHFKIGESKNIVVITPLLTGLTNIFIFGVFQSKVNKEGEYKIIYYTIARFNKIKLTSKKDELMKIQINDISKYKLLSIYTHVSFLLLHVSFIVSSFYIKDIIILSIYLLFFVFLMIKFIYTFSKTFVVRSERMKIINTLVHIKMFEQFIQKNQNKKSAKKIIAKQNKLFKKRIAILEEYNENLKVMNRGTKLIRALVIGEASMFKSNEERIEKWLKTCSKKIKTIQKNNDAFLKKFNTKKPKLEEKILKKSHNIENEWNEYLNTLDALIERDKILDANYWKILKKKSKMASRFEEQRWYLAKVFHETIIKEYLEMRALKTKEQIANKEDVNQSDFEMTLFHIYEIENPFLANALKIGSTEIMNLIWSTNIGRKKKVNNGK